jgi:hypothetical protein
MGHVEVDAEALMARGKKVFDRVERSRLDEVDHHRRRQHRDASRTDKGGRMLGPDQKLRRPGEPGGDGGEIDQDRVASPPKLPPNRFLDSAFRNALGFLRYNEP